MEPIGVLGKIATVGKLPKTRTGKVMRGLLRALAANQPLGDLCTLEEQEALLELQKELAKSPAEL